MATITVDLKEINRLSVEFVAFPRECQGAMANAINRAISKGKTGIAKEVQKEYSVKTQKSIKKTLSVKKASRSSLIGEIDSTGRMLRVADFPFKGQSIKGRPLSVNIKKSNGYVNSPHMFTPFIKGTHRTGNRGVYQHDKGGARFQTKFTLSVPQMIKNDSVYDGISKIIKETYEDRLYNHELPYMIAKAQARISGG